MFNTPYTLLLRDARASLKWTQEHLANRTGLSRARICDLELGRRTPTLREMHILQHELGFHRREVTRDRSNPAGTEVAMSRAGFQRFAGSPFYTPVDRPACIRYYAAYAAYPDLVPAIVQRLHSRADFGFLETLSAPMRFDSRIEILNWLHEADTGAEPMLFSPNLFGGLPRQIVHPKTRNPVGNRPHPCLVVDDTILFFQVSLLCGNRVHTVDLLHWDKAWKAGELDGGGHDYERDPLRDAEIGLPIVHVREAELVRATRERRALWLG